ncbi:MAG: GNAT family N-acetyltransferase [Acidobacteria bacterium]|nr:MAG: GNAT family N-acetyltransferase [Acidobacteriota bacterium]REK04345.1 MAG: GNAT family N-acetyltransferase [Acidobacteriota bacterium]
MEGPQAPGRTALPVRAASADELERLAAIERHADQRFREQYPGLLPDGDSVLPLEALQAACSRGLLWVVEDENELAGFACARPVGSGGRWLLLEQLSVTPRFGRLGLGGALLRRVQQEAVSRGLEGVALRTFEEVPWNAPWYRRHGFYELVPGEAPLLHEEEDAERRAGLALERRVAMAWRSPSA